MEGPCHADGDGRPVDIEGMMQIGGKKLLVNHFENLFLRIFQGGKKNVGSTETDSERIGE